MPLSNSTTSNWDGWLVDELGQYLEEFRDSLVKAIDSRNIPNCSVKMGTLNMWWRPGSHYIDVESTLDGSITTTIHFQEYGTSLWIGRAVESYAQSNYYKRMAARAFLETIDRCIRETILTMVESSAVREVPDFNRS